MFKSKVFQLLVIFIVFSQNLQPCTTGLVDKKYATNKRAILWKNRDSSHNNNGLHLFRHHQFKFFGIINNNDTTQVWSGVNNFGFAIMNSESRDMITVGDSTYYDDEGYLMKEALQQCKNIDDFENYLKKTNNKGRKVTSNFGVIDASGKAVYFETGNSQYFRFDADNEFIIRANFSMFGRGYEKYGLYRYDRAKEWFARLKKQKKLTPTGIINNVIADPYLTPTVNKENFHEYEKVLLYDSICRYSTVAVSVVEGIKNGENPEMTTFWLNLGHSASSVSIPLWIYSDSVPETMNGLKEAELNKLFRDIRKYMFEGDRKKISPQKYVEVRKSLDLLQKKIDKQTAAKLKKWRKNQPKKMEVKLFQDEITKMVMNNLKELLSKILK